MLGVTQIIKISAPILEVIYPCAMTIILLGLFNEKIKDDLVFKVPSIISLIFGFLFVLQGKGLLGGFGDSLTKLPLTEFGLGWVCPMLVGLVIALVISSTRKTKVA